MDKIVMSEYIGADYTHNDDNYNFKFVVLRSSKNRLYFQNKGFKYSISYKFPHIPRDASSGYGSSMDFDELFRLMCVFNGYVDFVKTFFINVFPTCESFKILNNTLDSLRKDIFELGELQMQTNKLKLTKSGKIDKRTDRLVNTKNVSNLFLDMTIGEASYLRRAKISELPAKTKRLLHIIENREGREIADKIRNEIIYCLRTGLIPLVMNKIAKETLKKRARLGITNANPFYATGQLIKSMQVEVIIR